MQDFRQGFRWGGCRKNRLLRPLFGQPACCGNLIFRWLCHTTRIKPLPTLLQDAQPASRKAGGLAVIKKPIGLSAYF